MSRTLVVGDSLGVGTAPHLRGKVVSDVKVGRRSSEAVRLLKRKLRHGSYDRVIFDAGTNDASAGETRRSIKKALRASRGTPVYVATVNGPDAQKKNQAIRRSGANVVDWAAKGKTGGDGIHASDAGYAQRARMFERAAGAAPRPRGGRSASRASAPAAAGSGGIDPGLLASVSVPQVDITPIAIPRSARRRQTSSASFRGV